MKEIVIGEAVVRWLEAQDWDVYQEVVAYGSRRADIVAVNGNLVWVIECKTSLTLTVMDQARRWPVHYRSVAVPFARRGRNSGRQVAFDVAKNYFKVGILVYEKWGGDIREEVPAPLMRQNYRFAKKIVAGLVPEQKTMATAGAKGGDYYTPYRGTMMEVRRYIEKHPGCTMKEMMDALGKGHYASTASARSNIPKNLLTIESDWCRVDTSQKPYRFYIKES